MARALAVLCKIPASDRVRFARQHLTAKYPEIVAAFDALASNGADKTVLFLSLRPQHAREPKLAAAARLAGWEPILLYYGRLTYDANRLFSFHAQIDDELLAILASWMFPGPLVHLFAQHGAQAHPFCRTKHRKVILDLYDTCTGMKWQPTNYAGLEREAIKAADGMTHRDLRVQYLRKLHGLALPPHNSFVLDPLVDFTIATSAPRADHEVRVVSAGWIGDNDSSILQSLQALCSGGVHVHFYPYPPGQGSEGYRRLQLLFPSHFHLEQPVFGATFAEYLTRYDFGLNLNERFIFGEEPTLYSADYLRGCGSSRLMDYIRADLGVIVPPGLRFQYFTALRYASSVVPADLDLLRNPRPILEAARLKRRPPSARHFESIMPPAVADRLGRFYARVASGANTDYSQDQAHASRLMRSPEAAATDRELSSDHR